MIKAVIFDLDNTLIDFMHMKNKAVDSAIDGMIESGLNINPQEAKEQIFKIYEQEGYEYQEVLNEFIHSIYKPSPTCIVIVSMVEDDGFLFSWNFDIVYFIYTQIMWFYNCIFNPTLR